MFHLSPLEWRLRDYAFIAKRRNCENASMLRKELNVNIQSKYSEEDLVDSTDSNKFK